MTDIFASSSLMRVLVSAAASFLAISCASASPDSERDDYAGQVASPASAPVVEGPQDGSAASANETLSTSDQDRDVPLQSIEDNATVSPPPAEVATAPAVAPEDIFAYIESLTTLEGRFIQVAPDGRTSEGAFYLRRPGRMRFEYDAPSPILIVADGSWVVVQDTELETADRYPIRSTPLKYLLNKRIDWDDLEVAELAEEPGAVSITLRSRDEETPGAITMAFDAPALSLRHWQVEDAQGLRTLVALSNVTAGGKIDPRKFVVEEEGGGQFLRDR